MPRSVDLPHPEGPISVQNSPAATVERHVVQRLHRAGDSLVALAHALDGDQVAHDSWRISRAMTMRWTSDVPSPISVSLASRKIRSMGNSVM